MKLNSISDKYKISCVGIGGHYRKMEEGLYDGRYAKVEEKEIKVRRQLIEKAISEGINYFDTNWRNEVEMLSRSIKDLGIRDRMFINGMVVGAFTGSAAAEIDVCDYFNQWLDERLLMMPDNRFNSFMISSIEQDYEEEKCEKLVSLLEKRKKNGDFDIFGFSCHDINLARIVADCYPEFEIIMLPYNYRNRKLETVFKDYKGNASLIAMKPLVWAAYGIPFCVLNELSDSTDILGIPVVDDAASMAIEFVASKKFITSVVCSVNNEKELDNLVSAGSGSYKSNSENELILNSYNDALSYEKGIPFFISALLVNPSNRRIRYFGVTNLAKALNKSLPAIPLNTDDSDRILSDIAHKLILEARDQGYGKFTYDF